MKRFSLSPLVIVAALVPYSLAQAQSNPHAGMQHHGAVTAAPAATGVTTTPADNSMLNSAPAAFSATFPHAMTLTSLKLTGPTMASVEVAVPATNGAATTVSIPLPALAPGSYSVAWAAKGADDHEMSGVVRFMVH